MTDHTFPTLEVASAVTGIGLCDTNFSRMQEIISALLGREIWTHEMAHDATLAELRARGTDLFPDMPTPEEARDDFEAAARKAVAAYGKTVTFPATVTERTAGPVETLREMKPDAKIVVVTPGP